jgi:hypothetical protein
MDIPKLLRAARADLDRLKAVYDGYPEDTPFSDYSPEDRRAVRALQGNIKAYEGALRQMQGSKITYVEPSRAFATLAR